MTKAHRIQYDARRGHYLVQIRRNGVRRYFMLGTNRQQARDAYAELAKAMTLGTVIFNPVEETTACVNVNGKKDVRVEELAHLHLEWVNNHRAAGTFRVRQHYVLQFLTFIGGVPVSKITRQKLEEYYQWAKTRGRTLNGGIQALAAIKAMLRWGEDEEICELAFKKFPRMSHESPTVVPLDDGELQKLLAAAPADFQDLLRFGVLTGLRPQELRGLMQDNLRTKATGDMYVWIGNHKTSKTARVPKPRTIALCTDAEQIVKRQIAAHPQTKHIFLNGDGTPYTRYGFRTRLDRLTARAGVRKINPYILRHTFATWESEAGVETTALSQMMGHSTTRMLDRYVSNTHEHHKKAVEMIAARVRMTTLETSPEIVPAAKEGENVLPNVLPTVPEAKRTCDGEVASPSIPTG